MRKKALRGILLSILMAITITPVYAETTANTEVEWVWTVPAAQMLSDQNLTTNDTLQIKPKNEGDKIDLDAGTNIKITINSENGFSLNNTNSSKILYQVKNGSTVLGQGDAVIDYIADGSNYTGAVQELDFITTKNFVKNAKLSGMHTDNIVFTMNIDVIPNAVFLNDNGTTTILTWDELKLEENGTKYGYDASKITDNAIGDYAFFSEETGEGCESLTSITIPEGVTSIGNYAFAVCINLQKITIPSSITTIGEATFSGCNGITDIILPEGVTSIGIAAFGGCENLESVSLPDSLITIGGSAFTYCPNLKNISIPEGVTVIEDGTFSNCSSLTEIIIPDGVTFIGADAFSDCSGLTSISIPNGVTSIGEYAFSRCNGLKTLAIPDGITSIESGTFSECSSLTSITIPDSVTTIERYAFEGCSALENITFSGTIEQWNVITKGDYWNIGTGEYTIHCVDGCLNKAGEISVCQIHSSGAIFMNEDQTTTFLTWDELKAGKDSSVWNYKEFEITDTSVGMGAFGDCKQLIQVNIPDSITSIDDDFACDTLESIGVGKNNAYYSSEKGVLFNKEKTELIIYPRGKKDTIYSVPSGVTNIQDNAFVGCEYLTQVDISDSVTDIGICAFTACSNLTSITIPNSVINIGMAAFVECRQLTHVYISDSVTNIGEQAFAWCTNLSYIEVGENNTCYMSEDGILFNKQKTELIAYPVGKTESAYTIPSGVKNIATGAFIGCENITSIVIPDGVTNIGMYALASCWNLTNVTIPNSVIGFEEGAFSDSNNLVNITFSGTIEQWNAITKADYWDDGTGEYIIYCSDGNLNKTATSTEATSLFALMKANDLNDEDIGEIEGATEIVDSTSIDESLEQTESENIPETSETIEGMNPGTVDESDEPVESSERSESVIIDESSAVELTEPTIQDKTAESVESTEGAESSTIDESSAVELTEPTIQDESVESSERAESATIDESSVIESTKSTIQDESVKSTESTGTVENQSSLADYYEDENTHVVPDGGIYYIGLNHENDYEKASQILNKKELMPKESTTGDVFVYEGYEYRFNMQWNGSEWEYNEGLSAWGTKRIEDGREIKDMLEEINGYIIADPNC